MSDNEDILGDDLGDHSLADYNLGNEEEEELLADDYDHSTSQNVPTSDATAYGESVDIVQPTYDSNHIDYSQQPASYPVISDSECVVPNITTEVQDTRLPEHSTYAPYPESRTYELEHAVPPPIPAAPIESPQIVPSEVPTSNIGDLGARERFTSERPPGSQRTPQVRDIPDSLDKVVVPRGGFSGRGRNSWRNPHYRTPHPYRRNNMHRNNYVARPSFTPQVTVWANQPKTIRPNIPEIRSDIPPPKIVPDVSPERPMLPQEPLRPVENRYPPSFNQFRPNDPRPFVTRPAFEPRPAFQYPPSYPRFPPIREIVPSGVSHIPQVTIHQHPVMPKMGREPEVRMLPMQLPPNIPPGGLAGKKVLINPHFKGNFQPPVEGLPTYIPTRIQKSPPLSPTLEQKFGPIKDIDDAAERFIAEQRNALARAAGRKLPRRSPQRYIENTTIEIENELARRSEDEELLRRQEEFINANRAGLRRRMRSPSPPPRRSPSPRRSPPRRTRNEVHDEESEYRRRLREQESLRERVLRAKEVRRRKNAVALQKQIDDKERDKTDKDDTQPEVETKQDVPKVDDKPEIIKTVEPVDKPSSTQPDRPDTTRSPDKEVKVQPEIRERSPISQEDPEVNSTCENLTPPREEMPVKESAASPERALTPPLPPAAGGRGASDDELDLILDDIDGILSDDDDTGRFKDSVQSEEEKQKSQVDLRSKLVTNKPAERPQRQKIVFEHKEERKKDKSPVRRTVVTSSTKADEQQDKKTNKTKSKSDATTKSRTRIIFNKKETEKPKEEEKSIKPFSNRRVVLQRKPNQTISMGIFTRAVRTAINSAHKHEPQVEYASDSDEAGAVGGGAPGAVGGGAAGGGARTAHVDNLPHGITDTRLKTLAGDHVQNLVLDKEERRAKLTFKTSAAAESFKKKFHNKMVAASRLTVTLR
ncbi:serine/arginine repetitive matrix protein 1-like isoform X2 [Papilio machaon]|uniref:serine/arginine repetitive matrix protein 1-like isoform X1 n=1 Tax=Papilio machaon TaxID=76193 RepID=UPI001E662CAF|nr:serine/arginine repetitive matrix protein 1-like isoform X1 [Papilio machaon]XP_045540193.1 serine/arginine repetitive matrix protein 1-like isoform X2 [Papilio machaon]